MILQNWIDDVCKRSERYQQEISSVCQSMELDECDLISCSDSCDQLQANKHAKLEVGTRPRKLVTRGPVISARSLGLVRGFRRFILIAIGIEALDDH